MLSKSIEYILFYLLYTTVNNMICIEFNPQYSIHTSRFIIHIYIWKYEFYIQIYMHSTVYIVCYPWYTVNCIICIVSYAENKIYIKFNYMHISSSKSFETQNSMYIIVCNCIPSLVCYA